MERKGQQAMELITAYGWVLLVVISGIGVLYSMGVINPSGLVSDKCVMGAGLTCYDLEIQEESVSMMLVNGQGKDMTITSIEFSMFDSTCAYVGTPIVLRENQELSITTNERCLFLTKDGKIKIEPKITYFYADSDYTKTMTGEIITTGKE